MKHPSSEPAIQIMHIKTPEAGSHSHGSAGVNELVMGCAAQWRGTYEEAGVGCQSPLTFQE